MFLAHGWFCGCKMSLCFCITGTAVGQEEADGVETFVDKRRIDSIREG